MNTFLNWRTFTYRNGYNIGNLECIFWYKLKVVSHFCICICSFNLIASKHSSGPRNYYFCGDYKSNFSKCSLNNNCLLMVMYKSTLMPILLNEQKNYPMTKWFFINWQIIFWKYQIFFPWHTISFMIERRSVRKDFQYI